MNRDNHFWSGAAAGYSRAYNQALVRVSRLKPGMQFFRPRLQTKKLEKSIDKKRWKKYVILTYRT